MQWVHRGGNIYFDLVDGNGSTVGRIRQFDGTWWANLGTKFGPLDMGEPFATRPAAEGWVESRVIDCG